MFYLDKKILMHKISQVFVNLCLVLSLKLAEVIRLKERLGCPPILLLDDVSSELDTERTRLLFDVIDEVAGQVWVSSTGAAALPISTKTQVLNIKNGQIEPAD